MKTNSAWAAAQFAQRANATVSYLRRDGEFTVWLPQDKRTWRVDDRFGCPVCDRKGNPRRFMSKEAAISFAAYLAPGSN